MENSTNNKKVEAVKNTVNATNSPKKLSPADSIQNKVNANSILKKQKLLISGSVITQVGTHIGVKPEKWNPKMKPYIYAKRSNNHVINLVKTLELLHEAYDFVKQIANDGGKILIVGTNGKMIKDLIKEEARRGDTFHITQRWLGGTLTNFKNISKSIKKLNDNINLKKTGAIEKYTKKEQLMISRETEKLMKFYGGIRTMRKMPQLLIVIDPNIDRNAILEAKNLNIPVIAFANTNADPDNIDYVIPMNNHSIRSITLILGVLVDAVAETKKEAPKFVGKTDEEIESLLPEIQRRQFNRAYVKHNNFKNNNNFNKPKTNQK